MTHNISRRHDARNFLLRYVEQQMVKSGIEQQREDDHRLIASKFIDEETFMMCVEKGSMD